MRKVLIMVESSLIDPRPQTTLQAVLSKCMAQQDDGDDGVSEDDGVRGLS